MKTKSLALLCLLLMAPVSWAVVVQAEGLLQGHRNADMTEIQSNKNGNTSTKSKP